MVTSCISAPVCNGPWWFLIRALFSAQRNLNLYVDPLTWDHVTSAEPTEQCSFVRLLWAMLVLSIGMCRSVLRLLCARDAAVALLRFALLAFGHLAAFNGGRTRRDRLYAAGMLCVQMAALLPAALLFAAVYASVARAAWLCVFSPALHALSVVWIAVA